MFTATVLRVMIASPGDTAEQRRAIREAIDGWNSGQAERSQVVLLPLTWEMDAYPLWGEHPQAILNEQLADRADVLVATFSTRLGTATPEADSGTVEEIERVAERGVPVLLYFDQSPINRSDVDLDQMSRLQTFRNRASSESFYREYRSAEDLRFQVMSALPQLVSVIAPENPSLPAAAPVVPIRAGVQREQYQETDNRGRLKSRSRYYLVITNISDRPLHDVSAKRRAPEGVEEESLPRIHGIETPIPTLGPEAPMRFGVSVFMGSASMCDLVIKWTDDSGEGHEFISTLRFA